MSQDVPVSRNSSGVIPTEPKLPVVVAFEEWWRSQHDALEMTDKIKFAAWNGWLAHSKAAAVPECGALPEFPSASAIRLAIGEMTAGEMRTAVAAIRWTYTRFTRPAPQVAVPPTPSKEPVAAAIGPVSTRRPLPILTSMTFESDCIVNGEEVKAGTVIHLTTTAPVSARQDLPK